MCRDHESKARAIAENVVSILRHKPVEYGILSAGHEAVLAGLMHELLTVMPTESSDALAAACSRFLDTLPSPSKRRPWVEAVNSVGGCVTMREGKRVNAFKGRSGSEFL
ncbi:hypothetical protein MKK69_25525 [Methylobacterium sp. J-026]|uniref:hypothetical protein n=1 Tax=Methylobacterium sp. J-026 TaxID=2836624 RepID=UPI001FB9C7B7|nr:hypothetical protein [Methylobacterium sp. J-026]MCJ2137365.1 hypothetical protein [Methylobacterium sp. J-026]